jgi:hypothetical protein
MGWTYRGCDGIDTRNVLPPIFSVVINRMDRRKVEERTQTRRFRGYKSEASEDFG